METLLLKSINQSINEGAGNLGVIKLHPFLDMHNEHFLIFVKCALRKVPTLFP